MQGTAYDSDSEAERVEDEDEDSSSDDDDSDADDCEYRGEADAIQCSIRDSHLELNVGLATGAPGSLQAVAREQLVRSGAPLPGEDDE